jgi:proteasome accessory factor B
MDKLERLLNLTATLLEANRPLTSEELRERVPGYPDERESFRRQFERDKDDLREMGIPIRLETVAGTHPPVEGYRVDSTDYYLPDPGLTPEELAALHLAASMVQIEGIHGVGAVWKLGGAVSSEAASDASAPTLDVAPIPGDANLIALFSAVIDRRVAWFSYNGAERETHPYRLDHQRGHWYLTAFDRLRAEERVFRVDRVEGSVRVGDERGAFTRPEEAVPGLRLEPWELGEGEPTIARLLVDADQAPVVVRHLGADSVDETRPDGSVIVHVEVTNPDGFRTFVLGFLDHAEVLEPESLREHMIEWLAPLAERAGAAS